MGSETAVFGPLSTRAGRAPGPRRRQLDHRFHTAMAAAISLGVFGGFARTYFARSYFHGPVLPFWVHVHGAVFTAWMVLYLVQNVLALNGRMKLHRGLGMLGAALAPAVVCLGLAIAVRQARQGRSFPFPDIPSALAVSAGQMVLFAAFVGVGLLRRRDGEWHKRLMLMATQLFFFPAFGRLLGGLNPLSLALALCFYTAGPVYDRITRGRVHPAYRWGVPLLILTMPPFAVVGSHAPVWQRMVHSLLGPSGASVSRARPWELEGKGGAFRDGYRSE